MVMFLCEVEGRVNEFESDEFESAIFEAGNDFADQATLNGVWFQHDIASLIAVGQCEGGSRGGRSGSRCDCSADRARVEERPARVRCGSCDERHRAI